MNKLKRFIKNFNWGLLLVLIFLICFWCFIIHGLTTIPFIHEFLLKVFVGAL